MADEPRSVVPPAERPTSLGNLGLPVVSLPARLLGGTAIQVTRQGFGATVSLDIGKLSDQSALDPATTWVACWTESGHHFRVPLNIIPSDAPLDGNFYGRRNGEWQDVSAGLTLPWGSVTGKPATFPPTLPIAQSGVTGLPGALVALQSNIDALTLNIPDQPTAVAGADNTKFMTSLRTKQQVDTRFAVLASVSGAAMVGYAPEGFSLPSDLRDLTDDEFFVTAYGAISDGASHALSTVTLLKGINTTGWTLSQWQAVYPHATSLSDEIDWCALQAAVNAASVRGGVVTLCRAGRDLVVNRSTVCTSDYVRIRGRGRSKIKPTGNGYATLLFSHIGGGESYYCGFEGLEFDNAGKSSGLDFKVEFQARFKIEQVTSTQALGCHFRCFNDVEVTDLRSTDLKNTAFPHVYISGGELLSGTPGVNAVYARQSDVITFNNLKMSGTNPNNAAPTIFDRHGVIVDGYVNTTIINRIFAIGVEGLPIWTRNQVTATQPPGYIQINEPEIEWPSYSGIRLEAGFICIIDMPKIAGAYAAPGIQAYPGFRRLQVNGGYTTNCGAEGIQSAALFTTITGHQAYANSRPDLGRGGTAGAQPGIRIRSDTRGAVIANNICGDDATPTYQSFGIIIENGTDNFTCTGNVGGAYNVGGILSNTGGTSATKVAANNA